MNGTEVYYFEFHSMCNVGMINWGKDGDVSSVMGKKRYLRRHSGGKKEGKDTSV
jgi:hypothetical protein